MVTVVETTGSMISTLDASNLSYELERVRVKSPDLTEVSKVLAAAQQEKKIPSMPLKIMVSMKLSIKT